MDWKLNFDERELREIELCTKYSEQPSVALTPPVNYPIIAKMAALLACAQFNISKMEPREPDFFSVADALRRSASNEDADGESAPLLGSCFCRGRHGG